MIRALLPLFLLLASVSGGGADTVPKEAQPTLIYFSDVPISWVPGTAPEDKVTFFNWMGRTLTSSGEPALVALDREALSREAAARGLDPVVLRDPAGAVMHVAFEESDLEPLCEMAVDLGIKYIMKVRLPTSSSRIDDSEPAEEPVPGAATIFTDLPAPSRKVAIEYTVYHSADKKILVTRDVEIQGADGSSGFTDAQVGSSIVRTIVAELAFLEKGTLVLPGPVRQQKDHPIWLGYQDGVSYLASLDLIEAERIDNANVRLTFSIRNELEKKLTIEPVAEEKEGLRTYLEDALGIVYRMTLLESGGKTILRPGERKDFSLTFKAPPLNVQKVSLRSLWSLGLGEDTYKRSVQLSELSLHEVAEAPPTEPEPVPDPAGSGRALHLPGHGGTIPPWRHRQQMPSGAWSFLWQTQEMSSKSRARGKAVCSWCVSIVRKQDRG